MESLRAEIVDTPCKMGMGEVCPHNDGCCTCFDGSKEESSFDAHCRTVDDFTKKDPKIKKKELIAQYDENVLESIDSKWIDVDPVQKNNNYCVGPESPWIDSEKNVPWWHTTYKDDLASLVAQKSLDYFENCDLPSPQKTLVQSYPSGCHGSSDHDDAAPSSLDWKPQSDYISSPIVRGHSYPSSESIHNRQRTSIDGHLQSDSYKPFSYNNTNKVTIEMGQVTEGDPCKAQLLEALRHSQTRAREAEVVAKQACEEKEHIIKLFFKQASQLFAYKQWFQLLQLETLYYQVKNGE